MPKPEPKTDKPSKPRGWTYEVHKWNEYGGDQDDHWEIVARLNSTSECRKWIDEHADAKDGEEYRTVTITGHYKADVSTQTVRNMVPVVLSTPAPANPEAKS